ncbi:MAG: hemolysin III family protein [Lachnospiraceae bacterium]|nr:hemolysin III family protein [Lachnospiraceae bacterium]
MKTLTKIFKDPGSAITHFLGMAFALIIAVPLLSKATDNVHMVSMAIFVVSMFLLYSASTTYHTFDISESVNTILKKIDHMMIFVLIAGSYTPVCLIVLHGRTGYILLSIVWGIALIGIIIKSVWVFCPKWFSSILYIAMGWTCVFAFSPMLDVLSKEAFGWLLAGGILYTIGGVIYALKLPIFNENHKFINSHVVFHIFVLAGSACHFMFMYRYVVQMPV